jgi:hypothetical protein
MNVLLQASNTGDSSSARHGTRRRPLSRADFRRGRAISHGQRRVAASSTTCWPTCWREQDRRGRLPPDLVRGLVALAKNWRQGVADPDEQARRRA